MEKALCVYFNSTIGALELYGNQSPIGSPHCRFGIASLRRLKVPDFAAHGWAAVLALAAAYERDCRKALLPLPAIRIDPVRSRLDEAVADALGARPERVARIRAGLAEEPFVTGKRYEGDLDELA